MKKEAENISEGDGLTKISLTWERKQTASSSRKHRGGPKQDESRTQHQSERKVKVKVSRLDSL